MNLYSIDIKICGTAYIKAESEEEAAKKAASLQMSGIEVYDNGLMISERKFTDPRLPEISLSPAMTIHGTWERYPTVDLVEESL